MKRSVTLQSSPTFSLWMTNNAMQAELRQVLKPLGLNYTQYLVLLVLIVDLAGATWNHEQLKRHSRLNKMIISRALNLLDKSDLILRRKNLMDGRNISIRATNRARPILQKAIAAVEAIDRRYLVGN